MTARAEIVAEARTWLDTLWQHQQRTKGLAVDCAGLVLGVGKAFGLLPADYDVPGYQRTPDGVGMLVECDRMLVRVDRQDMRLGDVLVVSIDRDPQHLGILGDYRHGGLSLIHAASTARPVGRVIETRLMFSSTMQFVAAYRFPGVDA